MISCNEVILTGKIDCDFQLDHNAYDENFYKTYIRVNRQSGYTDVIPLIISEYLVPLCDGSESVTVYGQYRSHNTDDKKLMLYVFVTDVKASNDKYENHICLDGYICKQPNNRSTPKGRNITDTIVAIPRPYGKQDYIPVIFWNRNASQVKCYSVGEHIMIQGRIQSREYNKHNQMQIAYEVSCSDVVVCE